MAQITVVLPTYNGLPYVKQSVASVLNQNLTDFEFLICDDASTDGTWEFLQTLDDSRIRLFRNQQNKGLFPTLNFLIKQATTDWIHLWSQDDIMYPNCLEEEVKFAARHPQVPFFFCQRDIIDESGKIVKPYAANYTNETISVEHLVKVSILAGSITGNIATTVVKKSAIEAVGYFNEKMKYSADFDLWERITRNATHIGVINKPLIQLRDHSRQLSRQHYAKIYQLRENREILANWLKRVNDPQILRKARRGINWKIKPMFFAFGLEMLKASDWQTAKEYFAELAKWENVFFIAVRYFVVRLLRLLKLERKFYFLMFYKRFY